MIQQPDSVIEPDVLPFGPVLYLAWADGHLSSEEVHGVRERLVAAELGVATVQRVERWLDPDRPPDPSALGQLLDAIRAAARSAGGERPASLAALGEILARSTGAEAQVARRVREALEDVEPLLGVVIGEATRAILPEDGAQPVAAQPEFDVAAMSALLSSDHADVRRRMFEILVRPEFAHVTVHDIAGYRRHVLEWCRLLAQEGLGALAFAREFGGDHDPARAIVAFEALAHHDLSLLVKFGVQFGLFGGSIWLLGTRRHHERWLSDVATLDVPGCFAMTETAHGSNVRDIETTATYLPASREFEIHTPNRGAFKDYIGNAALHGRLATVFAQLSTGGARHGVHAFLVPIRDDAGNVLPGVQVEDCGPKQGLNGVDNGRIAFDHVRVPRENLLNRFGDVAEDGTYTSPIASAGRRFFTMLGTLVAGRVAIAAASLSATKSGLTIGIRYAARRRQFGPEGRPEVPILDYLVVQRSLLPRLATAYALGFAVTDLVRRFAQRSDADAQEVEALAAGLKAWASRNAVDTLQSCREACGGQGYLDANRISILRADTDVFTTFEGANPVLLQLVAKSRLTEYREQFGELRLWNVARWIGTRAARAVTDRNPIVTRRSDSGHLNDPEFHLSAFRFREERLLHSLARRLRHRIEQGEDSFAALIACQDHAVAAAEAFIERHVLDCMRLAIAERAPAGLVPVLDRVSALFALSNIERNAAFFLEKGYLDPPKAEAIRSEVNGLCGDLRHSAVALVNAFGIPDTLLAAPIAFG